ncbi:GNAT family N-acetyltransferase [Candidatus Marithioploca araucensis]|uniref:GNAT family N-acetyltransferase n=1 Tax=Candidatus Marithioploca araucensis TaxID=70273 RepID=A0ABT7VVT4_9GAMM|nr:GNAT family N-acetyltransferase [Candidatus Marithioploca araucensis]
MKNRRYHQGEEQALWSLFYNSVHKVNSKDYSQAQIEAWAPSEWDMPQWKNRLRRTNPFVAEENGQLLGFAELEHNGHIDCFYCAHNWQRKGVGSALLNAIEANASKQGIARLYAEASITAKGFFESKGFSIEGEQTVSLREVQFTNYAVSKHISS